MEEMKKTADELLDEQRQSAENGAEERAEGGEGEGKKPIEDAGDQLRKLTRGTLTLLHPFKSHDQDVTEIKFDFCNLTGNEMMDALDSANVNNMFNISNEQAMALFAATAAKCAPWIDDGRIKTRLYDAKDVKARLGAADAVKALQLAKLFYHASGQAGNNNISKF